jgi:hypothetical protein
MVKDPNHFLVSVTNDRCRAQGDFDMIGIDLGKEQR